MDYINVYLSARKNLNHKNLETLSSKQIDHIGKLYKEDYYQYYKKKVFLRWLSETNTNSSAYLKRAVRNLKKLNVTLNEREQNLLYGIEPREFTEHRAMKTLEVPYKHLDEEDNLLKNAYFSYRGIRAYKYSSMFYEQIAKGEIFITKNEFVIYDRTADEILTITPLYNIKRIVLRSFAIMIQLKEGEDIFLRYKDNELIYISLNRAMPNKNRVQFNNVSKNESDTTERTIESILDL